MVSRFVGPSSRDLCTQAARGVRFWLLTNCNSLKRVRSDIHRDEVGRSECGSLVVGEHPGSRKIISNFN